MVIEILKEAEALWEGHFLLSSGHHSDKYVQCAKLLQYPDKSEKEFPAYQTATAVTSHTPSTVQ